MHARQNIVNIHGEKIGEIVLGYKLDEVNQQASSSKDNVVLFSLIVIVIGVIVGAIFGTKMTNTINEMLQLLKESAEGEGDLTKRLTVKGRDEIGELGYWFNEFVEGLEEIIAQVKNGSEQMAGVVDDMRNNFNSIISGIDSQADLVEEEQTKIEQFDFALKLVENNSIKQKEFMEEIQRVVQEMVSAIGEMVENSKIMQDKANKSSAAIEEMGASIEEVSSNIQSTNTLTKEASDITNKGKNIVLQTVDSMKTIAEKIDHIAVVMDELNGRSSEIGEIIGVIEEVADQTNLLALNAAIEAARAGEAGKGFAVVADEIRKLAERTSKATKEIGQMIKNIQSSTSLAVESFEVGKVEVNKGLEMSGKSEEALDDINDRVGQVSNIMDEISLAVQQQAQGTHQIIESVGEMTEIIDQVISTINEQAMQSQNIENMIGNMQELSVETNESVIEQSKQLDVFKNTSDSIHEIANNNKTIMGQLNDIVTSLLSNANNIVDQVRKFKISKDSKKEKINKDKSLVKV